MHLPSHVAARFGQQRSHYSATVRADRRKVVESVSSVLASLAGAGHAWRREQAAALQREEISINRIAALFGVTRQRISALLRENGTDSAG